MPASVLFVLEQNGVPFQYIKNSIPSAPVQEQHDRFRNWTPRSRGYEQHSDVFPLLTMETLYAEITKTPADLLADRWIDITETALQRVDPAATVSLMKPASTMKRSEYTGKGSDKNISTAFVYDLMTTILSVYAPQDQGLLFSLPTYGEHNQELWNAVFTHAQRIGYALGTDILSFTREYKNPWALIREITSADDALEQLEVYANQDMLRDSIWVETSSQAQERSNGKGQLAGHLTYAAHITKLQYDGRHDLTFFFCIPRRPTKHSLVVKLMLPNIDQQPFSADALNLTNKPEGATDSIIEHCRAKICRFLISNDTKLPQFAEYIDLFAQYTNAVRAGSLRPTTFPLLRWYLHAMHLRNGLNELVGLDAFYPAVTSSLLRSLHGESSNAEYWETYVAADLRIEQDCALQLAGKAYPTWSFYSARELFDTLSKMCDAASQRPFQKINSSFDDFLVDGDTRYFVFPEATSCVEQGILTIPQEGTSDIPSLLIEDRTREVPLDQLILRGARLCATRHMLDDCLKKEFGRETIVAGHLFEACEVIHSIFPKLALTLRKRIQHAQHEISRLTIPIAWRVAPVQFSDEKYGLICFPPDQEATRESDILKRFMLARKRSSQNALYVFTEREEH